MMNALNLGPRMRSVWPRRPIQGLSRQDLYLYQAASPVTSTRNLFEKTNLFALSEVMKNMGVSQPYRGDVSACRRD